MTIEEVKIAAQALFDKKGVDIMALDLRDASTLTDYVLVATGNVERHVVALAKELKEALKPEISVFHEEGMSDGDWVALDYVDFMVHILKPDLRNFYQIESIWPDAKSVDLEIVSKEPAPV